MTLINAEVDALVRALDAGLGAVDQREARYSGQAPLRYAADEVRGDLRTFGVNLCRLAVDAVAERMRVKRLTVASRGNDISAAVSAVWNRSQMDQLLQPLIVDVLALGSAYLMVWSDQFGNPVITPESARNVAVLRHPVTGDVTAAIKRWQVLESSGAVTAEHIVHYGPEHIVHWSRQGVGDWTADEPIANPLGVVPVIPIINTQRIGDTAGYSVIDDMAHLVDALSKILADMLVASEDTARPRRWASGVDLEERDDIGGFTADGGVDIPSAPATAVSPFESGNRMFTVESPDAKFGQLPGADLKGYETAVQLVLQQIMAISALPAHMVGVTTSNPSSADAIRAAEASLTARAESRIRVISLGLERALAVVGAIVTGAGVHEIASQISWASPATKSTAQEADAVTKLHALGIITTPEAREMIGMDGLL